MANKAKKPLKKYTVRYMVRLGDSLLAEVWAKNGINAGKKMQRELRKQGLKDAEICVVSATPIQEYKYTRR